jgi:hypothetical protein
MLAKIKPKMRIMLEYECAQITQGSTMRYVNYQDTSAKGGISRYIYTVDRCNECWIPQLVDGDQITTPWTLRVVSPADYMVITSGVQTERVVDTNQEALHVYEVDNASKIGLICCKFPKITAIEGSKSLKGQFGCFMTTHK